MTRTTVIYREWTLEVDHDLTRQTYANIDQASAESCGCAHCRNFAAQRENIYPTEIKALLSGLGIDFRKETEVSHFTKLGNGLHYYSGWFHFKGDFSGKDGLVSLPGGGNTPDYVPITDKFSIGFTRDTALTKFEDKQNIVQVGFACTIPWVIEKESETE